jgi:hypothetical protein
MVGEEHCATRLHGLRAQPRRENPPVQSRKSSDHPSGRDRYLGLAQLEFPMAAYQPIRVSPVTWSKWASRLMTGSLCWRAMAAIHRSFIGMGVPAVAS